MTMRIRCLQPLFVAAFLMTLYAHAGTHKQIVGATEVIHVEEVNLSFTARVDTGAKTSSIHAEDIRIDPSGKTTAKPISFYLVNKQGQSRKIETQVASVTRIKTPQGSERRYNILLTIKWNDSKKTILVNLNDRKKMDYALLLGRNWLQKDFLVDIDKNNPESDY